MTVRNDSVQCGNVILVGNRVQVNGMAQELRPQGARLLRFLMLNAGRFATYGELAAAWGLDERHADSLRNTIRVHVCWLRGVVGRERIQGRRNLGYRLFLE